MNDGMDCVVIIGWELYLAFELTVDMGGMVIGKGLTDHRL